MYFFWQNYTYLVYIFPNSLNPKLIIYLTLCPLFHQETIFPLQQTSCITTCISTIKIRTEAPENHNFIQEYRSRSIHNNHKPFNKPLTLEIKKYLMEIPPIYFSIQQQQEFWSSVSIPPCWIQSLKSRIIWILHHL